MSGPDLEAILDECLQDLSTRGETIEECLQRYPQYAGQLIPLVQVAEYIRKTSHPMLSVSASRAMEQRLLKKATELRQSRVKPGRWSLFSFARPVATVVATLVMVLALVLVGGGGIVYASTDSLPGSPLYGVKRATEQAQLFLAPAGTSRAELHIRFAQRRLEEVQALAEVKSPLDEEVLAAIAEETESALREIEGVPVQDRQTLLDKLVSLTERQQAVLKGVQAKVPEAAQKGLSRALEASQRGHEKAREALGKERPGQETRPTGTPMLVETPKPSHVPKPLHTPKPTQEPKPTHVPGEPGQGQGPPSTPPGQLEKKGTDGTTTTTNQGQGKGKKDKNPGEEDGALPTESPDKGKDKDSAGDGSSNEPPGQSGKEQGTPAVPPGQSGESHGEGHGSGQGKDKDK